MDNFLQDIKYGFRSLRTKPGITVLAILALALGIGANTALFSILYGVLWKPLPLKNPENLAVVWETNPHREIQEGKSTSSNNVVNPANYADWREQNKVFTDMAAFTNFAANLGGEGEPEEVPVQYATPNLFKVLGVNPILGRTFVPEDGAGEEPIVVLSYGLWKRRYAENKKLIGKQILINGRSATVVGIMPKDFKWFIKEWSMTRKAPELWVAYPITPEIRVRQGRYLAAVARLKNGVSIEEARANMTLVAKQLESQYYDFNAGWGAAVIPLREQLSGELRKPLWILAGAVGFVLLIACTNVANLMLSRAISRSREIAVRSALGAGRSRIVRQLLTESVLLSLIGGTGGVILAVWGTEVLSLLGQRAGIDFGTVTLNPAVLLFAVLVSVVTGLFFGIVPAIAASNWNLNEQLKEGSRGTGGAAGGRLRSILVTVQIAVALVLLAAAGLLIQSFVRLTSVNPGFDARQVLTFRILLPRAKYPEEAQRVSYFRNTLENIQAIPGVKKVGIVSFLPFGGPASGTSFRIEGRPIPKPGQEPVTSVFVVDDGFFATLKIPLIRGRMFNSVEVREAKRVVLINEALARKYFPGEDPIGKKLTIDMRDENANPPTEIIGIVANLKHESLSDSPDPSVYWPHPELPFSFMTFVIRTEQDPLSIVSAATAVIHNVDPQQPLSQVRTLEDWLEDSTARAEFSMSLLAILAGVALALAIAGIYGVMSHAVLQRTQEMGIRMALGANSMDVFKLILKEGSRLILAGVLIGCAATLALTRLMKSMLYETSTTDPVAFSAVVVILMLAALAACWIPSRRASRVDPIVALRYE